MREYARISPRFWMGETGRLIRGKGPEPQLLALYLLTSPHSNMIGLYWCPVTYMAHETGMTMQGASKALQSLVDLGFCHYDAASEVVWVIEMARYQVGERLSEKDKQTKGVQNAYDDLPKNAFLPAFFLRYKDAFCMTNARFSEAPSEPLASKEKEKEKEREKEQETEKEARAGFDAFWSAWPSHSRKTEKDKCLTHWKSEGLAARAQEVLTSLEAWKASSQWVKDDGQFIPAPMVWLRKKPFDAAPPLSPSLAQPRQPSFGRAPVDPGWLRGFGGQPSDPNVIDAESARLSYE